MSNKQDINLYLLYEFGIEGDETQVSDDWPFELQKVGRIKAGARESDVYRFSDGEQTYVTLDIDGLTFYPAEGMTIEMLELELEGRIWIKEHEPIDLKTARLGDESIPRTLERRASIEEIASRSLGTPADNIQILEGLFLRSGQIYMALVRKRDSGGAYVVGSNLEPYKVSFSAASDWRRLSLAIGEILHSGKASI